MRIRKEVWIIIAVAIIVVLGPVELYEYFSRPEPPELQGELLCNQKPLSVELLVTDDLVGNTQTAVQFHIREDGSIERSDERFVLTTSGLVTEEVFSQTSKLNDGQVIRFTSTDEGGVFVFLQREPTEEHYFTVYEWNMQEGIVFEMALPKIKEDPSIFAIQKDGDIIYLYDYDSYEQTKGFFITAIDTKTKQWRTWDLPWETIAGESVDYYGIDDLHIGEEQIAVYDNILYLAESGYPDHNGIETVFLSAYDLNQRRRMGTSMLGKDQIMDFYHEEGTLYVLSNPMDGKTIRVRCYEEKTMRLMKTTEYALPETWVERASPILEQQIAFRFDVATVTDQLVFAVLPVQWEEQGNSADLVAYDRESGALVWHTVVTLNEMDYVIRRAVLLES
jgi:hypothetical protein